MTSNHGRQNRDTILADKSKPTNSQRTHIDILSIKNVNRDRVVIGSLSGEIDILRGEYTGVSHQIIS